jgi:methyl coenzyme M reductase gamma subunit
MIDHEKIIREFKAAESQAADAITGYIRDKVRYIDHIPSMYFLPGAPSGALVRPSEKTY